MDDLEWIELSAGLDFFAAAPPDVAEAFDLAVLDLGGAAALSIGARPAMLLFNRVLGLHDDSQLSEVEAWFGARRCSFAITVRRGAGLEGLLAARGYRPASSFMKFRRGAERPSEYATSLRVERIDEERAGEYGAVVASVFGIGAPLDRWFAALCTRPGWACFGALDRDRLVGTAAAHFAGGLGWLGVAGTLPGARGRGCQSALLAARIGAARDAGARVLATETADRVDGDAGASFRNVVRAGFEEAYVQRWWLPPQRPARMVREQDG